MNKTRAVAILRITALIGLCCLGVALYPAVTRENLQAFISRNTLGAPAAFVVICTFRPLLFFLPSLGLTIIAGALFGAVWGTLYVCIGGALSTVVGFYFARWLGRDLLERLMKSSRTLLKLDAWAQQHGRRAVLCMRVCNLPWDVVSYWAGLTGIAFRDFYLASMMVLLPISFLYTYFGSQVFTPKSLGFVISLVLIVLMGSIPYWVDLRKKSTHD
jgi:uncharacterized membrane protein YdjX (TVP38/TMEM64 family)